MEVLILMSNLSQAICGFRDVSLIATPPPEVSLFLHNFFESALFLVPVFPTTPGPGYDHGNDFIPFCISPLLNVDMNELAYCFS